MTESGDNNIVLGSSWSWSYGSRIYNYQCNRCLLPLTLWVRFPLKRGVLGATLCDKVCPWHAAGWWFSPETPVSFTNKTDRHDIAEILLKMALNTITITRVRCYAVLVPVSVIAVCLIMSYDTASGILQKKIVLFISLYERVSKKSNLITLLLHDKNVQKKYYTMLNRIDFAFLANLISYINQKKT
jgi:hypothetical protein